jgi:aryl-alcohol dehydrogenase-like predicted oxidoreductase
VALQNEYSLFHRDPEDGLLARCAELGVGFVPYFPLASGLLTGKYRLGGEHPSGTRISADDERAGEERLRRVEELVQFAEDRHHTILELAIGALASRPSVASIISGATSPEQVRANAAAAGAWALDGSELAALDAVGV